MAQNCHRDGLAFRHADDEGSIQFKKCGVVFREHLGVGDYYMEGRSVQANGLVTGRKNWDWQGHD